MLGSEWKWIPLDPWVIDDRTGFKVRKSQTVKDGYTRGLRVSRDEYDPPHPQDKVRGRRDRQAVRDARPRPADVFLTTGEVTPDDF